ncbi:MAG: 7-cyano-7-deazaguanine synthase QueC [Alphaproteobacteria bacterium]|nr:7-cyano-7-deazaguanine synthase QueC [Alphaproteobacteria bacterium]
MKAIILLSGGLDSTTVLAIAKNLGYEPYALSFDYGQRHKIELESAEKIAKQIGVTEHKIAKIDLRIFGGSALTANIPVPKSLTTYHLPLIPITYVPARNTIFLSYALAYAETIGAFDIFIGVNAIDYSGYPDCRPDFILAFEKLANLATAAGVEGKGGFKIHSPLIKMSKKEIIETGIRLGLNYFQTHSCYDPIYLPHQDIQHHSPSEFLPEIRSQKAAFSDEVGINNIACGECDSCRLRLAGFAAAGVVDPIIYRSN